MLSLRTLTLALLSIFCTCVRAQIPLDTSRQMDRDVWFMGADEVDGNPTRGGIRWTEDGPAPYNGVRLAIDLSADNAILTDPGNGQVLAYSNGKVIVDASHRIMPGGEALDGVRSTRHHGEGVLFIPDPADCKRWRLLHQEAGNEILDYNAYYAIVDLDRPGNGTTAAPLGEVTQGSRRIFSSSFADAISEGINAILKAPDSRECWLFMTSKERHEFIILNSNIDGISIHRRYSLDAIFPDAFERFDRVENNSIEYHEDESGQGRLLIGVQANGDLTDGNVYDNWLGVIRFDRTNGELLDEEATVIITEPTIRNLSDALFSGDGTKVYWFVTSNPVVSNDYTRLLGTYALKQYDFNSGEITVLESTFELDITDIPYAFNFNMAFSPDGKIYHCQFPQFSQTVFGQNLSAVSRPNLSGLAANHVSADYFMGRIAEASSLVPSFAVQPRAPEIRAAYEQLSCDSVEYLLSATTPPWGAAPFSYRWSTGATGTDIVTTEAGRFAVTVTDANGCEQYAILELEPVDADERLPPSIVQAGSNCPGSALKLRAEVPAFVGEVQSFTWQTPSGAFLTADSIIIPNIDFAELGRYQLSYVDALGCPGPSNSFNLEILPTDFSLGLDTVVCDTAYTFGISGQLEDIVWNTGDAGSEITVVESGTYGFVAVSPDGCVVSDSVGVRIQAAATAVLPDTFFVLECEEIIIGPTLATGPLTDFGWSSELPVCQDCPTINVRGETEGIIRLTAADRETGCPVRDSTYLRILRNYEVYVPNAFSPNGDGINDRFTVYTKTSEVVIEQLIIYNRWGCEVFSATDISTNDPSLGWDGGGEQPSDINTYAYFLVLRFADGGRREIKGGVQLMK